MAVDLPSSLFNYFVKPLKALKYVFVIIMQPADDNLKFFFKGTWTDIFPEKVRNLGFIKSHLQLQQTSESTQQTALLNEEMSNDQKTKDRPTTVCEDALVV